MNSKQPTRIHQAWFAIVLGFLPGWSLTGRVFDAAMKEPVMGARVQAIGGVSVVTDSNGRFSLHPAPITSTRLLAQDWQYDGNSFLPPLALRQWAMTVHVLDSKGSTLHVQTFPTGASRLAIPSKALEGLPIAFLRIHWSQGSHWFQLMRQGLRGQWMAYTKTRDGVAPRPLPKSAALGSLEISHEKLISRTVEFADSSEDLGDIVLDYPAQILDVGAKPPYGAIVLFDGGQGKAAAQSELTEKWQDWLPMVEVAEAAKYTAARNTWKIVADPKHPGDTGRVALQSCCNTLWGYDDLQSKQAHGDAQIHVEFICMGEYDAAENPNAADAFTEKPVGKGYCNSGVYVQSRYELQIYSVTTDTAVKPSDNHNWTAALVGDHIPNGNAYRKNGEWQAYDITFRAARYGANPEPARLSVWWNGKLVHDNVATTAPATGIDPNTHSGEPLNETLYGVKLQSEGRDVRFRNIWIKPLRIADPQTRFGYGVKP
jgi:Domain of Unknown Function (DUF1080)